MKEKFIQSSLILMIGGFFTKLLGMMIKILIARLAGEENLGLYMMILPTFNLLISLGQFGMPLALSKLISEGTRNNKRLILSFIPILLTGNGLLIGITILLSPIISETLLHNPNTQISILAMASVIPFTTLSSICRSYFFGKQQMIPHIISNIVEDLVRLILLMILTPKILPYGTKYYVCFLVSLNIISEIASTLVLILFLPKNITIKKQDFIPQKRDIQDSLKISIPNTLSRLIGSIAYFLEPILLTTFLLKTNYSLSYITKEYGTITGYVYPLILLPSFFSMAISQALLPELSKLFIKKEKEKCRKKIKLAILLSLGIGIIYTIVLEMKSKEILEILYHTTKGYKWIQIVSPIFLLEYIQSPLAVSLDALGRSQDNLKGILLSSLLRTSLLILFSSLSLGITSLILSTCLEIIFLTIYQIKKVRIALT